MAATETSPLLGRDLSAVGGAVAKWVAWTALAFGIFATWAALTFAALPAWLLLPLMVLLGFAGGGIWAGIAAVLRAKGWLLEVFSTLLMNYLAILLVEVIVFGPWRDPTSGNYPQTRLFASS